MSAAPIAGCLDAPAGKDTEWFLAGTFTREATQGEMRELGDLVESRGGSLAILESFPAQFQTQDLKQAACEALQPEVAAKPYVASVRDCRERATSPNPDAPTSSQP